MMMRVANEKRKSAAYVGFDIQILKIISMFPYIHADDRDVGQEGVLIKGGRDFKSLGGRIDTLTSQRKNLR
jgi:hypothetical protein